MGHMYHSTLLLIAILDSVEIVELPRLFSKAAPLSVRAGESCARSPPLDADPGTAQHECRPSVEVQVQVRGTAIWQTRATVPLGCCLMWVYWQVELVHSGPTNQEVEDHSIGTHLWNSLLPPRMKLMLSRVGWKARQRRSLVSILVFHSVVFFFVFVYCY